MGTPANPGGRHDQNRFSSLSYRARRGRFYLAISAFRRLRGPVRRARADAKRPCEGCNPYAHNDRSRRAFAE